jgi:carbamoyltransferase
MLLVAPVKEERRLPLQKAEGDDLLPIVRQARSDIPAITHVDYSARIQTVTAHDHPGYYEILKAFEKLTGCAVLVNTSFNVRGEPIVNTPWEAYRCFMRTHMDALVLGNFLLLKEDQPDGGSIVNIAEPKRTARAEPKTGDDQTQFLRDLFHREFVPLAERLGPLDEVRVRLKPLGTASEWADYRGPMEPQGIFEIPRELDDPEASFQRMAKALTAAWTPGPVTEALRPLLARLFEHGRRRPVAEMADVEGVSESLYVMY